MRLRAAGRPGAAAGGAAASGAGARGRRAAPLAPRRAPRGLRPARVWGREPDAWDDLWAREEAARRAAQDPADAALRDTAAAAAAERAAARADAEARHRSLLERQQRRDALRDRWAGPLGAGGRGAHSGASAADGACGHLRRR
jgi:hypothetical protein